MARVDRAPRFSTEDAVRFARELYGLDAVAEPLPSERDQNFHLRDASDAQFVFKRSEEHTSELQSLRHLVCRLLLEKKKNKRPVYTAPSAPAPDDIPRFATPHP